MLLLPVLLSSCGLVYTPPLDRNIADPIECGREFYMRSPESRENYVRAKREFDQALTAWDAVGTPYTATLLQRVKAVFIPNAEVRRKSDYDLLLSRIKQIEARLQVLAGAGAAVPKPAPAKRVSNRRANSVKARRKAQTPRVNKLYVRNNGGGSPSPQQKEEDKNKKSVLEGYNPYAV